MWRRLGCNPREAPHIVRGLLGSFDDRFAKGNVKAGELAAQWLDPSCPAGTQGLDEEKISKLRGIRDRGAAAAKAVPGAPKQ
jgi:hypothetical protein